MIETLFILPPSRGKNNFKLHTEEINSYICYMERGHSNSDIFSPAPLLLLSIILGSLFEKLKYPSVIGEILAGVILGHSVLNFVAPNAVINGLSEISLFFIVLLIGIEATTNTMLKNIKKGSILTLSSFVFPLIVILVAIRIIYGSINSSEMIMAISIAVPSISIISVMLNSLNLLKIEAGNAILASVIITDVIAFVLTSAIINSKGILLEIAAFIIFLILIMLLDISLRKHSEYVLSIFERLRAGARSEKLVFGAIILSGLKISTVFELIGITYVLGAFFAGILISDVVIGEELLGIITRTLGRINDSFFIPLFFSIAGLTFLFPSYHMLVIMSIILIVSAFLGGLLDYAIGRRWLRPFTGRGTMGILGGRGAVGLIIATISLSSGIIDVQEYSAVIFATIIMSFVFASFVKESDGVPS
ncbi:cation:proton antiporter [Cuniculiplasma sp. SKW3]|uniref:cation:proton antiporter n=1 Tax=unclassified Cuniculiplasma TaxID=2619706 RepID=UPI003FD0616D